MDNSSLITIVGQLFFASIVAGTIMQMMKLKQRTDQQEDIQKLVAKLAKLRLILVSKVKRKVSYYRNVFPIPLTTGDVMDATLNQLAELRFESSVEFQNYIDICRSVNRFLKIALEKYEREQLVLENKRLVAMGFPGIPIPAEGGAPSSAAAIKSSTTAPGNIAQEISPAGSPPDGPAASPQVAPIPSFRKRAIEITSADIETEGPYSFFTPDKKMELGIILAIDEIVNCTFKIRDKVNLFNKEHPKTPLTVIDPITFSSLMDIKRIYAENPDIQKTSVLTDEKSSTSEDKSEPAAA